MLSRLSRLLIVRSGAAPLFSRRTLAPHAAQKFAPSMSVFPQLMQYMGVTRPTLRRGDERATDSDAADGCNRRSYRWLAGGAMRGEVPNWSGLLDSRATVYGWVTAIGPP